MISDRDRSIPQLVYCPVCKRRPMVIYKVSLGRRDKENVVRYICSKCGQSCTETSAVDPIA